MGVVELQQFELPPIVRYVAVGGTHSWSDEPGREWWQAGSPWQRYMAKFRFERLVPRDFVWESALDGEKFWRRLLNRKDRSDHRGWRAGAAHLIDHLMPVGCPHSLNDRVVFAHSHAGQLLFYACAAGLSLRTLITIGTPVRGDMVDVIKDARKNIAFWLHICDTGDRIARWGGLGDGIVRLPWRARYVFPEADANCDVDGIEHSRVLSYEEHFHKWADKGWIEMIRHNTRDVDAAITGRSTGAGPDVIADAGSGGSNGSAHGSGTA